jgi:hypothetical protein
MRAPSRRTRGRLGREMMGRTILVAVAATMVALPPAAHGQATGEIGGPPTMGGHLPFPPPPKKTFFPKATSEAIVIGVGFTAFGKVEIVGQGSKAGLCLFVDHLKRRIAAGTCGPTVLPKVIGTDSIIWESRRRRGRSLTELAGFMQPGVANVTAVAHLRKGRKRSRKVVPGVVALPGPDLLARLHQPTAFGYFVADFRGCITDVKVRVRAFDLTGLLLGSTIANLGFPNRFREFDPCEPGSSSVAFGVASSARTAVAP